MLSRLARKWKLSKPCGRYSWTPPSPSRTRAEGAANAWTNPSSPMPCIAAVKREFSHVNPAPSPAKRIAAHFVQSSTEVPSAEPDTNTGLHGSSRPSTGASSLPGHKRHNSWGRRRACRDTLLGYAPWRYGSGVDSPWRSWRHFGRGAGQGSFFPLGAWCSVETATDTRNSGFSWGLRLFVIAGFIWK